ncbi:MAG: SppA protein [Gammaproteobacteria bacterium]|nr:SppA protein [Gammaproteobacteria bacterium]MBU1440996.1 SppA protein [Gammaproteobacteria bacterium]MBU2285039.1 SppA protein [Gammaproteobacteria bacterium]MBU2411155.1 SppA protein [Gammaproteobacteria bacterium]
MNIKDAIAAFKAEGTDVYGYAGPIEKPGYELICDLLEGNSGKRREKALLYLCTGGGNPNAGYRIARAFIHHYGAENFRVAIPAECKSAGTLISIGASALVFFDKGELGPLDVQFQKQDEIFQQSSGLDIVRGMTYLQSDALDTFNKYLMEINGGSGLSTKVASEIASKLVMGIYEPMYAQIDPIRLGEMNAALQIAHEYGTRLNEKSKNLKLGALSKLINSYPTHGFVIDRAEARSLFQNVVAPSEHEQSLAHAVLFWWNKGQRTTPHAVDLVEFIEELFPSKDQPNEAPDGTSTEQASEPAAAEGGAAAGEPAEGIGPEQSADPGEQRNP